MKFGLLVAALAVAGCSTKANPASCVDDHCSDPSRPFCDEDGSIGGEPDTCIAVECTPGAFETCRGDNALHCNGLGNNFEQLECMEGCSEVKGGCNECADLGSCAPATHIVPRYLPAECDDLDGGMNDLLVTAARTIDTSVDATCNGGIVQQQGGPEICVVRHRMALVSSGQTLKVVGSRAFALVTDGALTIEGVLDVSGDVSGLNGAIFTSGPGGGTITSGGPGSGFDGAGGAGFSTQGGRGGVTTGPVGADNGGPARPDPALGTALIGGAKGTTGFAGGGGGAVTLISCRETLSVLGVVDAGGGGGGGGFNAGVAEIPASGGGSGGYVVLQGRNVTVSGQMFANGGGGGAGRFNSGAESGASGADGSRIFLAGGLGGIGVSGGGNGGTGASRNGDAGFGVMPTGNNGAGGGGGGLGYLQIYTPPNVAPTTSTAGTSPALQPHRTVEMK